MRTMLNKIKQKIHTFLVKDHDNCLPKDCEEAARIYNKIDNAWRVVELVSKDGPCSSYCQMCIQCTEYELACAIMNEEKPITDWLEWEKQ